MDAVVLAVLLVWVLFFALTLRLAHVSGRGAGIATWLGVTAVVMIVEFALGFFLLHAILFSLGREATLIALVVSVVIFTLTPAATMFALGRWTAPRSAHE